MTTRKPSSVFPKLPTMDSMYPGFESDNWYSMFAPVATPKDIVARLHALAAAALKSQELREFMTREGGEIVASSQEELLPGRGSGVAMVFSRSTAMFVLVLAFGIKAADAQHARSTVSYPERPIRFIVPFPPAGANDILARAVGQRLTSAWGQPVVIDNRPGAGGVTGTATAAKAAPDGYTIVLVPATHAINVSLYKNPPYDAVRDFAPVALLATAPYMLVVNPSVPVRSIKELIAFAKSKPGQLNYGSVGVGNATHLMGELLKTMAGIDITHVPYKGGAIALSEVIAGQVQLYFGTTSTIQAQAKAGKVRPLAVTGLKRSHSMPEVPTMDEAGVPGYDAAGWWGVLAPARTPVDIVDKLNREITAMIGSPDFQRWLREQGFEPAAGAPAHFARYLTTEIDKWARVVKASGARLE